MQDYNEVVQQVADATRNKPDIEIQQALIKAAPFHPNNLPGWRTYGEAIYKLTGRQMFGYDYAAIKAKEKKPLRRK